MNQARMWPVTVSGVTMCIGTAASSRRGYLGIAAKPEVFIAEVVRAHRASVLRILDCYRFWAYGPIADSVVLRLTHRARQLVCVNPSSITLQFCIVAPRLKRDATPQTILAPQSDMASVRHDDTNVHLRDVLGKRSRRLPWCGRCGAVRAIPASVARRFGFPRPGGPRPVELLHACLRGHDLNRHRVFLFCVGRRG